MHLSCEILDIYMSVKHLLTANSAVSLQPTANHEPQRRHVSNQKILDGSLPRLQKTDDDTDN